MNKISLEEFLTMSQENVLKAFSSINGSVSYGEDQEKFVYIEGKRDDKLLLVAHSDTVWGENKIQISIKDGKIESARKDEKIEITNKFNTTVTKNGIGIGADDRAGIAIIWQLIDSGHSILITSGEEQGCKAAKYIMQDKEWRERLNNHNFAIEFDRKNSKDIVFYDISTKDFVKYVKEETGYEPAGGSNTDIREICKDICGVNISTGYYNEHTENENIVLKEWENTLETVKKWISKNSLPKHKFDQKEKYSYYTSYTPTNYNRDHGSYDYESGSYYNRNYKKYDYTDNDSYYNKRSIHQESKILMNNFIRCKYCSNIMTRFEWWANKFHCDTCKREI